MIFFICRQYTGAIYNNESNVKYFLFLVIFLFLLFMILSWEQNLSWEIMSAHGAA